MLRMFQCMKKRKNPYYIDNDGRIFKTIKIHGNRPFFLKNGKRYNVWEYSNGDWVNTGIAINRQPDSWNCLIGDKLLEVRFMDSL